MRQTWLQHQLTPAEAARFERDGYLVVPNAITADHVARLSAAVERCRDLVAERHAIPRTDRFNLLDVIGLDRAFFELIDHPTTFPKLWRMLGWNIQVSHSHLIVAPPLGKPGAGQRQHAAQSSLPQRVRTTRISSLDDWWCWHRDSGQLKRDLGERPQPRLSVKIAYCLSDAVGDGDANSCVVPGSHAGPITRIAAGKGAPGGAMPLRVTAGSAVFIDRRLVHSGSPNLGSETRKVLYYGYSYRWIRPHDEMTVDRYLDRADPIRRQLLGVSGSAHGYMAPSAEDVPLRAWLEEHGCIDRA